MNFEEKEWLDWTARMADEEDVREMSLHCYASARQGELWWHDCLWLVSVGG